MNLYAQPTDRLFLAVRNLLARSGQVDAEAMRQCREAMDHASPAQGGRLVARAWLEPAFRQHLLADGSRAAEEMGIHLPGAPPLGVVENSAELHHLIVCTLCSCYPRALLGYPPFWYKSAAYRSRAVRDPRGLLREEWGTVLAPTTKLRVIDSTADYRWMVLPQRPAGTEGWSAEQLAALVRDTDLIGVTVPQPQPA